MIITYICGAILALICGWFAYLSYKDEFYPLTVLMVSLMTFIIGLLIYGTIIEKEIKNRIEMKVVVPKNSELKVNFVNEKDDSISKYRVQYIDTDK